MFEGTEEDLKQTKVTQPAIFLHSVLLARSLGDGFRPDMVAGHSLGEFSALVAAGALSFEEGTETCGQARTRHAEGMRGTSPRLWLRCSRFPTGRWREICAGIDDIVAPANYNCPGQVVISGTEEGIDSACAKLIEAGAKRALKLKVGGAFHSPLMQPAQEELAEAIEAAEFHTPVCPVYQNVDGKPHTDPAEIKENLIRQLTAPVRWTYDVQAMVADGADEFIELGPGNVLQGLVKKIDRNVAVSGLS